jgi:putative thioredoxin
VPTVASVVSEATDSSFTAVLELSRTVPVIVEFYGQGVEPSLAPLVESYGGRIALVTVHAPVNPQLVQAFQVSQVPTVAAVVAERPLQLFVGALADGEVRQVLDQVLQLALQQNVTGSLVGGGASGADAEPVEPPLPPLHQEAYDAIVDGNFGAAITAYKTAIAQNPRDALAVAGLAQVSLMQRLDGLDAAEIRSAAAADPQDVAAQLAVADLDVTSGSFDDAFDRLLDLFTRVDSDGKTLVRVRLLDYFEIAGADDPRVAPARRRLTMLLY